MSIENKVAIWIDGINRTPNLVLPLKFGNFLDERLDECNVSLRIVDEKDYPPLTPVEVRITNKRILGNKTVETVEETLYYVVANDTSNEVIIGGGLYDHELYCLEVTKVAECIVVDTLTYTNNLGRVYTDNANYAVPQWE